jgi:GT2 family glycosyltransferase
MRALLSLRALYNYVHLDAFDEKAYLAQNLDVAAAIETGRVRSARTHYIHHGYWEGRSPCGQPAEPIGSSPRWRSIRWQLEVRNKILANIAARANAENLYPIAHEISSGTGRQIVKLNRRIVRSVKPNALVNTFNYGSNRIKESLIVCLYGYPQFLPLQVALFSNSCRVDPIEFIFVNNSAEHSSLLLSEAKQAARLYDMPITLINPDVNLGFAAGNNLAAGYAKGNRLIFINPDVFPKDQGWLTTHNEFAATDRGRIFGVCLYYDDGTVMHAGVHVERETVRNEDFRSLHLDLLQVEHTAKGFPDWTPEVTRSRIVPAVTGAFISVDREHFESLGGFDEDFIIGSYEDIDFCLRSAAIGQPVWYCANVRLWHMEGKGSVRTAEFEGAGYVNRWLFTRKWLSSFPVGSKCTL